METSLNSTLKTAGSAWIDQEYTKLSKYTKELQKVQTDILNYQKTINETITKAQNEAKQYIEKFEQQAINEIQKYVKLDNISIGGFKL
jgi:DNA-binding protein YbaB